LANSGKKKAVSRARWEVLEKRVLYSADPVFGTLVDVNKLLHPDSEGAIEENTLPLDNLNSARTITELIIVDVSHIELKSLHASLLEKFNGTNKLVVTIDGASDAFAQLSAILNQHSDLDAIHLFSHGDDGALELGGKAYSSEDLHAEASVVSQWGEALSETGDLLLYGCNLSATDAGQTLASSLSALMKADVASSDDLTGHQSLGGDWDLEVEFGSLETNELNDSAPLDDWIGKLDISTGLVAHWEFDSNAQDSVGTAHLTEVDTPFYSTAQIGNGVNLGSSTLAPAYLGVADADAPDFLGEEFTLAFWAHPETFVQSTIIDQSDATGGYTVTMNAAGRIRFELTQSTGAIFVVTASNLMDLNAWNHVALTYEAGEVRVTVNGTVKTQSFSATNLIDAPADLIMGQAGDGSDPFAGALDDVRLYTRALSTADVVELESYEGTLPAPNSEEILANNSGFNLNNGETVVISNANLLAFDIEQSAAEITYTVNSLVSGISLLRDGQLLGLNDTFTQQDIPDGRISIMHDGNTASSGFILMQVDDGFGSFTTFTINVTAAINEAPTDLRIVDSADDAALSINTTAGNSAYFLMNEAADLLGGLTSFTFETRLESSSIDPPTSTLFAYGTSSTDKQFQVDLRQSSGLTISIAGQDWIISSAQALALTDGSEHTLAISWVSSTGTARAYIDGELLDSTTLSSGSILSSTGSATIGNDIDANTNAGFSGQFHDMRLFDHVRSAAQIQSESHVQYGLNEAGLIGYWTFDSQSDQGIVGSETGKHHLIAAQSTQAGAVEGASSIQEIALNEITSNGESVGTVNAIDPEREALLAQILADNPALYYSESAGIFLLAGSGRVDWDTAYAQAANMSINGVFGHLAMPNNAVENTLLINAINEQFLGRTWISANDAAVEGEYVIVEPGQPEVLISDASGNSVNGHYVNWDPAEPNDPGFEDYVEMYNHNGMWNDVSGLKANGNHFFAEFDVEQVLNGSADGLDRSIDYTIFSQSQPGAFAINNTTGEITINDSSLIDFETSSLHTLIIHARDNVENETAQSIDIRVQDMDEPNIHTHPSSATLNEDSSVTFSTAEATEIRIQDPDLGHIVTLALAADIGTLSFNHANNLEVSGSGSITNVGSVQLTGLVADLNLALEGMKYTPDTHFFGTDSITIESTQATGFGTQPATETITAINLVISSVNDLPTAVSDSISVFEGASTTVLADGSGSVLGNDTDADEADSLTILNHTQPLNGVLSLNLDGTFSYSHDGNETTTDSFSYTLTDNNGGTSTSTVNIEIKPVNDAPVAGMDNIQVLEGASTSTLLGLGGTSLLDNDTDSDSVQISVTGHSSASHAASLTVNADGSFLYTHSGAESELDLFTYTVEDDLGTSATGTVAVSIIPVNDAPIANDDALSVLEGGSASILDSGATSLLSNDSDSDNALSTLSIQLVDLPAHGLVSTSADGSFNYAHDGSETTSDSFSYRLVDASGAQSNLATVSIDITPVNDIPIAANDVAIVAEADAVNLNVLANNTDNELDSLSVEVLSGPTSGTAIVNADNTINYTHDGSETFGDTLEYAVEDGNGGFASAFLFITIKPVNDSPIAIADSVSVDENSDAIINVLNNDSDAESANLDSSIVVGPNNGSLVQNVDGSYTYTHDGSETSTDSFTYVAIDQQGASSSITTVSITVNSINDVPIAVNDGITLLEGDSKIVPVLINDTDAEQDSLSVQITSQPLHGTAIINADNTITYTHNGTDKTSDALVYTINDGNGGTATATLLIAITLVNDIPITSPDNLVLEEGTSELIDVLLNDTDAESSNLQTSIISLPANGSVVLNADGTYTYTHDGSETTSDRISIQEGETKVVPVLINDSDAEQDSLSVQITGQAANGIAVVNADKTISYTHDGTDTTSDALTYTINDSNGGTDSAMLLIAITPVNDAPVSTADAFSLNEGASSNIDLLINDSDSESISLQSNIVRAPTNGALVQNTDGTYTYTHDGSETTSDRCCFGNNAGNATDQSG